MQDADFSEHMASLTSFQTYLTENVNYSVIFFGLLRVKYISFFSYVAKLISF